MLLLSSAHRLLSSRAPRSALMTYFESFDSDNYDAGPAYNGRCRQRIEALQLYASSSSCPSAHISEDAHEVVSLTGQFTQCDMLCLALSHGLDSI